MKNMAFDNIHYNLLGLISKDKNIYKKRNCQISLSFRQDILMGITRTQKGDQNGMTHFQKN